ncbi:ABC transporter substrate-binding protein [Paenibacillus paeoniae]|uniref:Extracellular solute-binding protein n=1 Tax=Paenibacillus paeoniae TaxID=2292705 RepID=A0A371PIX2_9BACL|nr:extracellular solute-binding protein [Paenibacillus paeoniae]REK75865.1 extracellular solute-binding protein [Paenibacillus paeoniae]
MTMKTFKSVTAMALALVMLVSLMTACSSNNSKPGDGKEQPGTNAPHSKVVIPFWITPQDTGITAWFRKWTNEFNQSHDGVEVKLEFVPQDAWQQKLKAAQSNGTAPQIAYTNYASIPMSVEEGMYAALDDYMDPKLFEDLYGNIKEIVSIGDNHYSYPVFVEPYQLLFYRKDFFEEVGLDPESPPTSWKQLIDMAAQLTKQGRFGLAVPGSGDVAWTHWAFQNMIGHFPISDDWSHATVNDESYRELFSFWKTLYDEKVVPKQALSEAWDIKPLAEGRVAMGFNGSWAIGNLKNEYADIADKVGVAVAPTPDGITEGKTTAALGGYALTLDGKAKNPKEAAEFISYLVAGDPQIMKEFFETSQYSKFSARQSVDELINKEPGVSDDPYRDIILKQVIPFAKPEPWYSFDISSIYGTALETVISNGVPVDDALAKLEKDINDYIKVHNYANKNPKQNQ